MNLYIFKPSDHWDYCGGGLVISAPSWSYLKENYIIATHCGYTDNICLYRNEEEVVSNNTTTRPGFNIDNNGHLVGVADGEPSEFLPRSYIDNAVNCWVLQDTIECNIDESRVILYDYNYA